MSRLAAARPRSRWLAGTCPRSREGPARSAYARRGQRRPARAHAEGAGGAPPLDVASVVGLIQARELLACLSSANSWWLLCFGALRWWLLYCCAAMLAAQLPVR